jgi:hypothetical protein
MKKARNKLELVGREFGKLKVLAESDKKGGLSLWTCQCECGNIKDIIGRSLTSKNTKSCGKCRGPADNWRGCGEISGAYWSHFKHGALKRNKTLDVSIEEVWDLFLKQDGKCAISGVPLRFERRYIKNPKRQTASLDRIDNSKGYVFDNVQWVHKVVNWMKRTLTEKELVEWCEAIYKNKGK